MLFDFLNLSGSLEEQANEFLDKARQNIQWSQDSIMKFLEYHKERVRRKELAAGTLKNYYRAAKLFCEMNDLTINWKRISKGLPRVKNSSNDRAPTLEEIRKLIEYPDRRIKPIVYAMASGGFRLGAWDYLRWKHISPINNEKEEVIAAKLLVYADEPEEYYTFITPEAYDCSTVTTDESYDGGAGWTIETCSNGETNYYSPGGARCIANEASGVLACDDMGPMKGIH